MKTLTKMTAKEKAFLLVRMFPQEIEHLIFFLHGLTDELDEQDATESEQVHIRYWNMLMNDIGTLSENCSGKTKVCTQFAARMFNGVFARYTIRFILDYVNVRKHPNQKFEAMIRILFEQAG